jgi:hypothetical protein
VSICNKSSTPFQDAVAAAPENATIYFASGNYDEDVTIGTAGFTFVGFDGTAVHNVKELIGSSFLDYAYVRSITLNADFNWANYVLANNVTVNPTGLIQDGITLVNPGGTVTVNEGVYPDQISIKKNLTLKGEGNVIIQADQNMASGSENADDGNWDSPTDSLVVRRNLINVSDADVTISNITVDGNGVSDENTESFPKRDCSQNPCVIKIYQKGVDYSYADFIIGGIGFFNSSGTVRNSRVIDFGFNTPDNYLKASGISFGNNKTSGELTASIDNVTIDDIGGTGIIFNDSPDYDGTMFGTVQNSTITGRIDEPIYQVGIQFSHSNGAAINNTISDFTDYDGHLQWDYYGYGISVWSW